MMLCVADGGFSDDAIPQNLQELYFYRLFLGELLMAVSCLSPGGKFICKLYTSFSTPTAALLYLTTRVFATVEIVKPVTSKATGPERYLVASGLRENEETAAVRAALSESHNAGAGASPLATPLLSSIVSAENLAQDEHFSSTMSTMVTELCERQAKALNAVVDRADFLENMAMECAVCTDPWVQRAPRERETVERKYDDNRRHGDSRYSSESRRFQDTRRFRDIPTPARGAARSRWGNGAGYQ